MTNHSPCEKSEPFVSASWKSDKMVWDSLMGHGNHISILRGGGEPERSKQIEEQHSTALNKLLESIEPLKNTKWATLAEKWPQHYSGKKKVSAWSTYLLSNNLQCTFSCGTGDSRCSIIYQPTCV